MKQAIWRKNLKIMHNDFLITDYVTDTMALVLRLEKRRLSPMGNLLFQHLESGAIKMYVPGLVLAEILYLSEKGRIETTIQDVFNYFTTYPSCFEHPLDSKTVFAAKKITDIKELHDRLIAATAKTKELPLLTNDPIIQESAFVSCIW